MKLYVGLTDKDWFDYLSSEEPEEVNFWTPSSDTGFGAIPVNSPFLFKLKSPYYAIAGGGFFVNYTRLPLSVAWKVFGTKNGVSSYYELKAKILHYRQKSGGTVEVDPIIGCIVLTAPFFFKQVEWVTAPSDWAPNIVRGKTYNTENVVGKQLWERVEERLVSYPFPPTAEVTIAQTPSRYGSPITILPRLGQGAFRTQVIDAYNRRCAITGERTLPVLEAAHIRPFSLKGPHQVSNGLLLRSDLHTLFDQGYLTINEKYQVEVSKKIKEEYENGKEYYALAGRQMVLPANGALKPDPDYLSWHNQKVFVP